jgi:beta-lactamase regulating signal transducer with metallopeptidase domain
MAWLLETVVAVTVLMVLVLALRRLVARAFGAGWAYALWLIPMFRLILPPLPQLATEISLPPVASFIPATAAEMAAPLPAQAGPGQWAPLMLALWAGGAVIFLTLQWLSYHAFVRRLEQTVRPGHPPLFGGIGTWISDAAEGPMAIGALKRRIILPADFSRRYSPVERRLALEHELVHHRRGDIWWNLAAMIMLALFWFNPVAWFAFRAFRADQELACDCAVARSASADERSDYARALVKSATKPGLIAACALNRSDALKQRLRMMHAHRASGLRSAGGILAFALVAVSALALASGEPSRARVGTPQLTSLGMPLPSASVAAPLQLAEAARPAAAIRARTHAWNYSARDTLKPAPLSIASAQAPQFTQRDLAALAQALPPLYGDDPGETERFAVRVTERHVIQLTGASQPVRIFVIRRQLSVEDSAPLRRAVVDAIERSGGRTPLPAPRRSDDAVGGLASPIQTIVKGDIL